MGIRTKYPVCFYSLKKKKQHDNKILYAEFVAIIGPFITLVDL